jgi:antitoxin component of MazEF toxin-antitoxin module
MPIKRKICKIGTGLAIFLPKSWVQMLEEKHGPMEAVAMEVDGALIITPIFKKDAIVSHSNLTGVSITESLLEKRSVEGHTYG